MVIYTHYSIIIILPTDISFSPPTLYMLIVAYLLAQYFRQTNRNPSTKNHILKYLPFTVPI